MIQKERIYNEYQQVKRKYPYLNIVEKHDGKISIEGLFEFSGVYNEVEINDYYFIRIIIPNDYPYHLPYVKEIENRIPKDFHQFDDGRLCLGPPLRLKIRFNECPNLLFFIENFLVSYLFCYSYFEKYGKMPFNQYSHGGKGLYEYFSELFNSENINVIINLLRIIEDDSYRGHVKCPCGSNTRLRDCHGKTLLQIKELQTKDEFISQRRQIEYYKHKNQISYGEFPPFLLRDVNISQSLD